MTDKSSPAMLKIPFPEVTVDLLKFCLAQGQCDIVTADTSDWSRSELIYQIGPQSPVPGQPARQLKQLVIVLDEAQFDSQLELIRKKWALATS